ncbi:hypothetical protein [Acetivibrio ethanolgignens]|uniref:Uncharacterized protein n=1 Tax=Acetivibrio ethanolgignens TaxID=290052 RepID=A0A0V8QFB9_9FIRM|nr:hypothetical protein [Acetivibrio ethanolgignens]KSV59164.1 hypothetical protein ASU35_10430 [Acetivibrio ethanolgignens]
MKDRLREIVSFASANTKKPSISISGPEIMSMDTLVEQITKEYPTIEDAMHAGVPLSFSDTHTKDKEFWNPMVYRRWLPSKFMYLFVTVSGADSSVTTKDYRLAASDMIQCIGQLLPKSRIKIRDLNYKEVEPVTPLHAALNDFVRASEERWGGYAVDEFLLRGVVFTTINVLLSAKSTKLQQHFDEYSNEIIQLLNNTSSTRIYTTEDYSKVIQVWMLQLQRLLVLEPLLVLECTKRALNTAMRFCDDFHWDILRHKRKATQVADYRDFIKTSKGWPKSDWGNRLKWKFNIASVKNPGITEEEFLEEQVQLCNSEIKERMEALENASKALEMWKGILEAVEKWDKKLAYLRTDKVKPLNIF